jgi:uncharacterized protein (TIGR03437 family)
MMRRTASAFLISAVLASAAGPAPPAIRPHGVLNAAGEMPQVLAGGGIAPGALIVIRGWRLEIGGKTPRVTIEQKGVSRSAAVVRASEREIEALVPRAVLPGQADLRVETESGTSLPAVLRVVTGAFQPYRPGPDVPWRLEQRAPDGTIARNGRDHPARLGQTVVLHGTGLGTSGPSIGITAGGRRVKTVHSAGPGKTTPGEDEIVFDLPADTPAGCDVPIVVLTNGVPSNPALASITADGGPCHDAMQWLESLGDARRTGLVLMMRAAIRLDLDGSHHSDFVIDTGYAGFRERAGGEMAQAPLYSLPPEGVCTGYYGAAHMRNLVSPLSILELAGGSPLSAGPQIGIEGSKNRAAMGPTPGHERDYSAILGGNAPLPRFQSQPLFFDGSPYRIVLSGGKDVGTAETEVKTRASLRWTNRASIGIVNRGQGFTARWKAGGDNGTILIFATNIDQETGATGVCICRARSEWRSFRVPPEALANIPPSKPEDVMPFSAIFLVALPVEGSLAQIPGLDRAAAFFVAADGRTLKFH